MNTWLLLTALVLAAGLYAVWRWGDARQASIRSRRQRPEGRLRQEVEGTAAGRLVGTGAALAAETAEELTPPAAPGAPGRRGGRADAPVEATRLRSGAAALRPPLPFPDRYGETYLQGMPLAPGRFYLYWEMGPESGTGAPEGGGGRGSLSLRLTDLQAGEWRILPLAGEPDHRWVEARAGVEYLFELGYMDWESGRWLRTLARWGPARTPGPAAFPGAPGPGAVGAEIGWSPGSSHPAAAWGMRS